MCENSRTENGNKIKTNNQKFKSFFFNIDPLAIEPKFPSVG